jgi:hypothetical protein
MVGVRPRPGEVEAQATALLPARASSQGATLTDEQLDELLEESDGAYAEEEREWIRSVLTHEESENNGELEQDEEADSGAR